METRQSILFKRVQVKLGGHGMETGDPARHSREKKVGQQDTILKKLKTKILIAGNPDLYYNQG